MPKPPSLNQLLEAKNREAYRRSVHERAQCNLNKAKIKVEKAFDEWKGAEKRLSFLEHEAARAPQANPG